MLDVVVLRTLVQPASDPPAAYGYDGPLQFSGDLKFRAYDAGLRGWSGKEN